MKRILYIFTTALLFTSCDTLYQAVQVADEVLQEGQGITQGEAAEGLKAALQNGVQNGTDQLSKTDGFLKSPYYKILFPPEAKKVEETLRKFGFSKKADEMVTALNRGAEEATKHAMSVFIETIKKMTIKAALGIVTGGDGAATKYLKDHTTQELRTKFRPEIQRALDKVGVFKYWESVMTTYNKFAQEQINPDLNDYVLGKTMDALFSTIEIEENKIREHPIKRTSEILRKVFGYADQQKGTN
jgi:hypothetical protein